MNIKKGYTWRHKHYLEPDWTPGPDQKWRDGPKALMRVTSVIRGLVYYTFADSPNNKALFKIDIEQIQKGKV